VRERRDSSVNLENSCVYVIFSSICNVSVPQMRGVSLILKPGGNTGERFWTLRRRTLR